LPCLSLSRGEQKHVYLAFAPLQSDFPLQVSFPIFIANALDFLGGEANATSISVRAGNPFAIAAKAPVKLTNPEGESDTISLTGSQAVIRDVRSVGRYDLEVDGQKRALYAMLRSDRESEIDPVDNVKLGGGQVKTVQAPIRFADFWRPLILFALLVLAGEWWLYARRS
jgi:Ca-activated chloride channel homolog